MNRENRVPSTHECPLAWQQPFPFQQPTPICHSERSEEPAVRLDPSPIPKGKHTAHSNRANLSPTPLFLSPDTFCSLGAEPDFLLTVFANDQVCGSPQREPHAFNRSRGICSTADPYWRRQIRC